MTNAIQENIQVADIEKELSALWNNRQTKKQIRASLFNLIIYSPNQQEANTLNEIVHAIVEKFPCRIIFIHGDHRPEQNYMQVTVSNAIIGHGDFSIVCDQINIEVSCSQMHRVPYIILPHVVQDLPIYLLWGQNPLMDNHILPALRAYAEKLIFDSDCGDFQKFSKPMLGLMDAWNISFMDINWARVSGWRSVIAQTFDNDKALHDLQFCNSIKIVYNKKPVPSGQKQKIPSLYLQGWLAAQLGWTYAGNRVEDSTLVLCYQKEDHKIEIFLVGKENNDFFPGSIFSFELEGPKEHSYAILRMGADDRVVTHICSMEQCEMPFILRLGDLNRGTYFMQEFFYKQAGEHYRNMLRIISEIDIQSLQQ